MKKSIFFLVFSLIIISACNDDNESLSFEEQLAVDIEKIENYLSDSNLIAQSTESGLHYIIEVEGTGSQPTIDSTVQVTYVGTFLNGEEFDSGTTEAELRNYILGWQQGIPLFKEGGSGKLFLPSSLGYGTENHHPILGNSVLIFEIKLISVSE